MDSNRLVAGITVLARGSQTLGTAPIPNPADRQHPGDELEGLPQAGPGAVGLCLSGGGSRALSCAMGQLRALRWLGKLDELFVISSVSGGSWANSLFTYLPEHISDDDFLGQPVLDPSQLSLLIGPHRLDHLPPHNLGEVPTRLGLWRDLDAILTLKERHGYANDELWQGLIGEQVFKPYGLWQPDASGHDPRYFTWTRRYLQGQNGILAHNPGLKPGSFLCVERARPFAIFNTALFSNDGPDADLIPFECNFQLGVRHNFPAQPSQQGAIGGGLLDAFAMGGRYLGEANGGGWVSSGRPARPFALNDIAGCSSAAFAQMLEEQYPVLSGLVPRYPYWPVAERAEQDTLHYRFADGGSLENLGLNALLARGLRRLIVCVNTDQAISRDPASGDIVLSDDLPPLFGLQPFQPGLGYLPYSAQQPGQGAARLYRHNQVFARQAFAQLQAGLFAARQAGGAILFRQRLPVLANDWFDVPAQDSVELLWVYNDFVSSWWKALPFDVRAALELESGGNFPRYNTFTQLELSATLVNALAHLSCWCLASDSTLGNPGGLSNAQMLTSMFD
ncbi:hypothetical protein [Paucibacter sp. B51]|uniref:hypothetical protein n=1 Tax=Paucibacter sp. B51 TaxID=2993315 RepID=UPI0022EBAC1E|nr:hypothetical protein [Paucibacter sp. B51]